MDLSAAGHTNGEAVLGLERFEKEMYGPLIKTFSDVMMTADGGIEVETAPARKA